MKYLNPRIQIGLCSSWLMAVGTDGFTGVSGVARTGLVRRNQDCSVVAHGRRFFAASVTTEEDLDKKTVKELRQMIQDSSLAERGLLSKLTKKEDLIDFLTENLSVIEKEADFDFENRSRPPQNFQMEETRFLTEKADSEMDDKSADEPNPVHVLSSEIQRIVPPELQQILARKGITNLLPIQSASFQHVHKGKDTVIHAPTGSGKTLAFVLPLVAQMFTRPKMKPTKKGKHSAPRKGPTKPAVMVLVPSRELARQVGKEFTRFSSAVGPVATVFGGVPLERMASHLRQKGGAHVVVGTPGRIRELHREKHLSFDNVWVVVLDESDTMLDKSDAPDVRHILDNISESVGDRESYDDQTFQLLLVSATINTFVRRFAMDIMEIDQTSEHFISVEGDESRLFHESSIDASGSENELFDVDEHERSSPIQNTARVVAPKVHHWYTAVRSSVRALVAADMVWTQQPRLCLIFVPTKSETESVSGVLASKLASSGGSGVLVHTLHGDMSQASRSRTIRMVKENGANNPDLMQLLVSTDVASRGLDLPNVDLLIQFGIPRLAGKEGTCNSELYTHRTGRAGRVNVVTGENHELRDANAIMMYDPAEGEGKVLDQLIADVHDHLDVEMRPRPIPSTSDLLNVGYESAAKLCITPTHGKSSSSDLVNFFRQKLEQESRIDTKDPTALLEGLSTAMAALSKLEPDMAKRTQHCSLLTGDPTDLTLLVKREDQETFIPPDVTKFCKSLGSGKMGRIFLTSDKKNGYFDLPSKRALRLLETFNKDSDSQGEWILELAASVPDLNIR